MLKRIAARLSSPRGRARRFVQALFDGDLRQASRLCELGFDPNLKIRERAGGAVTSPMTEAVRLGTAPIVGRLLELGAHVNLRAEDRNALWLAHHSKREREAKLKLLIRSGADPNQSLAPSRRTLLTRAVIDGDVAAARFLLAHGATPGRPDYHGLTALRLARMLASDELVRMLLEAGAPDEEPGLEDFEKTLILFDPFWSQLHELIKRAVRDAGLELSGLRLESREPVAAAYRVRHRGRELIVRLELLSHDRITLLLLDEQQPGRLRNLIPPTGELGPARLRAGLAAALVELKAALEAGREPELFDVDGFATGAKPENVPISSEAREAFAALELEPGASREKVLAAYRRLAKRYHPDLNPEPEAVGRMRHVNRAYETLKNL